MTGASPGDGRDEHEAAPGDQQPGTADAMREAMQAAAKRSGYARLADEDGGSTGQAMLAAIGGVRGIVEAVLPGLVFVVAFIVTSSLPITLALSVGAAAIFTVWRLIERAPLASALGGLFGVAIAAVFALVTGRPEDNFVPGFITNAVSAAGLLVSVLVRWPAIGVIAGFLLDLRDWRRDRSAVRFFTWLTLAWVALFLVRLAAQLPLYAAGETVALGVTKLAMGLPLYAPLLVVTWLLVRAWSKRRAGAADAAA